MKCVTCGDRLLLENGADKTLVTSEGERPLDLIDHLDRRMIGLLLQDFGPLESSRH